MPIPVASPQVEAKLFKMVARRDGVSERYLRARRTFDLTPYLGRGGSVYTTKAVNGSYGSASIVFDDRLDPDTMDTIQALIEPMDMIEVRGSATPHLYVGKPLPLLMRFFVSRVRRQEGESGTDGPHRTVTVSGEDCGKLLVMHHVFWQVAALAGPEAQFLEQFRLQATTGLDVGYVAVGEFMRQVIEKVANKKIEKLPAFAPNQVRPFRVLSSVTEGRVSPNRVAAYDGTIWGLLAQYADDPWNELWVDDVIPPGQTDPGEEEPALIFRPVPFRDTEGRLIMPGAADPGGFEVDHAFVRGVALERTDGNVANWFWVPPGATTLESAQALTVNALIQGEPFDSEHNNNRPDIYGLKKMEHATVLLPSSYSGEASPGGDGLVEWHHRRMKQLRDINRDNVVWEDGQITIAGTETARAGREVTIRRGGFRYSAYVTSVSHVIQPLADWHTTLGAIRSTSFLERVRRAGGAILEEVGDGPYTPRTGIR